MCVRHSSQHAGGDPVKAWQVHRLGNPLEVMSLDELPEPEPEEGYLRVRVSSLALNFNDIDLTTVSYKTIPTPMPFTPGMEILGRVDATGPGNESWLGKRVVAIPPMAFGGYAEVVCCPAEMAFEMPEEFAEPAATAIYLPFHLSWLALHTRARLQAGETLLVHAAAGGVGTAVLQMGKHLGARVIATAGSATKLELCRSLGADVTIDYRDGFAQAVMEATGNLGVDVAFDSVGGAVTEETFRAMAFGGRHVIAGFSSDIDFEDKGITPRQFVYGNISLIGVCLAYVEEPVPFRQFTGCNFVSHSDGEKVHEMILDLIRAGKVRPVVGRVVPFDQIPQAMEAMRTRQTTGRIIATLT
jgi:NADPH2:quinone reductase